MNTRPRMDPAPLTGREKTLYLDWAEDRVRPLQVFSPENCVSGMECANVMYAFMHQGKADKALSLYSIAKTHMKQLHKDGHYDDAWLKGHLAPLYIARGKWALKGERKPHAALKLYNMAAEYTRDDAVLAYEKGVAYAHLDEYGVAAQYFDKALRLGAPIEMVGDRYSRCLMDLSRWEEAYRVLTVLAGDEKDAPSLQHLKKAIVEIKLGEAAKASETLDAVLQHALEQHQFDHATLGALDLKRSIAQTGIHRDSFMDWVEQCTKEGWITRQEHHGLINDVQQQRTPEWLQNVDVGSLRSMAHLSKEKPQFKLVSPHWVKRIQGSENRSSERRVG